MTHDIGGYQFSLVGPIPPERDQSGGIFEYAHTLRAGIRANRYGRGPFCKFELRGAPTDAGVYAITAAGGLKYIGECVNLFGRFGPRGYGYIAARNCHSDGQVTNCKVNALVLASIKAGEALDVWFHPTPERKWIEAKLLKALNPPWNADRYNRYPRRTQGASLSAPTSAAANFSGALQRELGAAAAAGLRSVRIRAGDLHRTVGGYPGSTHRMPICCQVMRSAMRSGDSVVQSPPRGAGANLIIEYLLPRRTAI